MTSIMEKELKNFLETKYGKPQGGVYIEVMYANYDDTLEASTVVEILEASDLEQAFAEKLDELYDDYRGTLIYELIHEAVDHLQSFAPIPDGDWEEEVEEYIHEMACFETPADYYKRLSYLVNIIIDTGDANFEFTLNTHSPAWEGEEGPIDEKASIVWLAKTQGYTEQQLRDALNLGDKSGPQGFLESMRVEMANVTSHINQLVFLVKMSLSDLIELNALHKQCERPEAAGDSKDAFIVLGKETMCGLFDGFNGGGSVLEIELEKDVKLPVKYIYSALPDTGRGYSSISNVYGMCGSAWKETLKSCSWS